MTDGSYTKQSTISVGQKVFYNTTPAGYCHSAIVTTVGSTKAKTYVTSKWGACGEFKHLLNDCPYVALSTTATTFWSK